MSDRRTYDVVVVGARAAGAATAMLLARNGIDVLLVDRGGYGTDTLSTHALMRAGVLQLARWGLLDQVIAAGTPPVRRTTFRYDGQVVPITIKPSHGVDALYAPRRTVLDPILVDAAAHAGADVRFGTAVSAVVRNGAGRVTGVTARTASGTREVRARLVIGADGMRSTIAELVAAPVVRLGRGRTSCSYGYWRGLDTDGYEWNFRPRAASGVIPTNGGLACVFAGGSPADVGRGGLDVMRRIIGASAPELAARLDAAEPASGVRTFIGRPGHIRRSWGPGWALVGDAGYFKDPLTAHGLTDALRDAELLARAVVAGFDGSDELAALATYQEHRDALSKELFEVSDVVAAHRWTDAEIGGLLLRLSAAMAGEVELLAGLPPMLEVVGR